MLGSIVRSPGIDYPNAEDSFSPSERYPEYPFRPLSRRTNPVYALVRRSFEQAGLDAAHRGTSRWNPLGDFVAPGARAFVLCNFVYHRRLQESSRAFAAKCIHGSVLRALCDYLLIATGPSGALVFGNAPLQSTDWRRVLAETHAATVLDFYEKEGQPVAARDLRLFVAHRSPLGRVVRTEERDSSHDAVTVTLGDESLLHEIAWSGNRPARFRVSDYRPERIEAFHSGAKHRYVVHRAVLESDVVVSLSKLKTHEKVGITCGLKGLVGMVGHKDCLAHHRFGPPRQGGDEYPPGWGFLEPVSRFQDFVQSRATGARFQGTLQVADRTLRRALRRLGADMAGAWHGNDTCWRMALDLVRIAHHAGPHGAMLGPPQRRHLSLIDGIVAGEGDGPLVPDPVPAGALVFSDDLALGDRLACRLMGFDPTRIPLVREAAARGASDGRPGPPPTIVLDAKPVAEEAVPPLLGRPFRPPRGWRHHLRTAG